jgi:hypothetical protein
MPSPQRVPISSSGNTYHLLRPGARHASRASAACAISWAGAVISDSGGYRVMSLAGEPGRSGGRRSSRISTAPATLLSPETFDRDQRTRLEYRDGIRRARADDLDARGAGGGDGTLDALGKAEPRDAFDSGGICTE